MHHAAINIICDKTARERIAASEALGASVGFTQHRIAAQILFHVTRNRVIA
jgi:hypothetical protein